MNGIREAAFLLVAKGTRLEFSYRSPSTAYASRALGSPELRAVTTASLLFPMMGPLFCLFLAPLALAQLDYENLLMGKDDTFLPDLYSRDIENMPGPLAWGHKFMGGGAGEGRQHLSPEGWFPNKQEVKTDAVLPAYCEPPNPCPKGYTALDGCLEEFENTADFSREYQARQNCLCDEEHMFNCPKRPGKFNDVLQFGEAINQLLQKAEIEPHKSLVAKKFHSKRGAPRRKRETNPYLEGERLRRVAKKGNVHPNH